MIEALRREDEDGIKIEDETPLNMVIEFLTLELGDGLAEHLYNNPIPEYRTLILILINIGKGNWGYTLRGRKGMRADVE